MDIRFLQSLVCVIDTGSIAAAARRDRLTPAAVSQRIMALERDLGCALLSRGAHSVAPTEACVQLLPRARRLIAEASLLKSDLNNCPLSGEIRMGVISTAMTGIIPEVLSQIANVAPALKLRLIPGTSALLYEQLLQGDLDAAILVEPPFVVPKKLSLICYRREPLILITRDPPDLHDIHRYIETKPFIRYDAQSWGGRLVDRYLESVGVFPEVMCDMDALETIAILVARGVGNSIVPAWQGLVPVEVHLTSLPDADAFERKIVLMHPANPHRSQIMRLLADILLRYGNT